MTIENQTAGDGGEQIDNPMLAAELKALESEAADDEKTGSDGKPLDFDPDTPVGQWGMLIMEVAPPVFAFVDSENEFEMREQDYKTMAKGVAPALAKYWPDVQSFTLPVEVTAALVVVSVMGPKIKRVRARRAVEAAKAEANAPENA